MESERGTSEYIPVGTFFSGKAVLVTGGTGFLGKVLVEKLLRSCPGVNAIYLLIRTKRGRSAEERLANATNCALFDRLKQENRSALSKMVPILGDMAEPRMGISPSDWALLTQEVSIVFHCAATVNLDEPLNVAVNINLIGTKRVLELCREMTQLQALVHVSTCYSNCVLEEVKEVVYPPPRDPNDIIRLTELMDDKLLAYVKPELLGKHPNTYTFTKALAESILLNEGGDLPITIVRPSIVASSWLDPMAGWVESLSGATGIIAASSRGLLRTVMADGSKVSDIVPVDVVIGVIICAAWRLATTRPAGLPVYNCSTGVLNPITWGQLRSHLSDTVFVYPSSDTLWYPVCTYNTSHLRHNLEWTLTQTIPFHVLDWFMKMSGKKPILLKIHEKLKKGCAVIEFVSTQQWRFSGDNVQQLAECLQEEDRINFRFDVREINWRLYLGEYLLGIRTHIFKEDPKTLHQDRIKFARLHWIYQGLQLALAFLFVYLFIMFVRF